MSQFDELLAQLTAEQEEQSTLAKAIPAEGGEDDEAIQAAAAEGAEGEEDPEDELDLDDDEPALTKSLVIDDEEVQVVDADVLIKSLSDLSGRVTEQESVLAKAMASMVDTIKAQGALIKSLDARIAKLGSQGTGRKAVLSVHEKPNVEAPLTKSQPGEDMTKESFLAKSEAAWNAGVINGIEFSSVDVALRTGSKLDPSLIQRIVNHK